MAGRTYETPELADKIHAAQILIHAQGLLVADAVWTSSAPNAGPNDVDVLGWVADEIVSHISALMGEGVFLARAAANLGDDAIAAAVSDASIDEDLKTSARRTAERAGGWVALLQRRFADLDMVFAGERSNVHAEMNRLRSRSTAQGDMSTAGACLLGGVVLVAGVLAEPVGWPAIGAGAILIAQHC